jgi:hypothetical protein
MVVPLIPPFSKGEPSAPWASARPNEVRRDERGFCLSKRYSRQLDPILRQAKIEARKETHAKETI